MRRPIPLLALALALAACGDTGPAADDDDLLQAVATVAPITNMVQNIGGDRVRVLGLVPQGVDSHTFEPRPADARILAGADVVFMNGLHLEIPTEQLAEANVREGVPIVKIGDRVLPREEWQFDFEFPEEDGDPNPHIWTSPVHAKRMIEVIRDVLTELRPDDADEFDRNFEAFAARIDDLDAAAREATDTVPPQNRRLLTYHDSFPYFAEQYGWEVVGAIQPSDFSEPSPREVARLIDQIGEMGLPAIFGSEVFPSPVLEQIARATGAEYIEDLRDDELPGEPGDPEHTYLGMMVFNFRTFMGALGGDVSVFDRIDVTNVAGDGFAEYR